MLKLETASDAALMVAIARMHEPALAEAYRRHGGAVLALARRVLGSADLAEEVTQEVFVDLWDAPERFDPGRGALRTFLDDQGPRSCGRHRPVRVGSSTARGAHRA